MEIGNQFANLILEGKEWIRQRGEDFERSQQAHVIKSRLSELQSARRSVIRTVGQQVAQILIDVEENVIVKRGGRFFGDDFGAIYDLLKNRLIFLEGGKDDVYFSRALRAAGQLCARPGSLRSHGRAVSGFSARIRG